MLPRRLKPDHTLDSVSGNHLARYRFSDLWVLLAWIILYAVYTLWRQIMGSVQIWTQQRFLKCCTCSYRSLDWKYVETYFQKKPIYSEEANSCWVVTVCYTPVINDKPPSHFLQKLHFGILKSNFRGSPLSLKGHVRMKEVLRSWDGGIWMSSLATSHLLCPGDGSSHRSPPLPVPSHMISMGGITVALKLHNIWTLHKCSLLQGDAELLLTDQQTSSTLTRSEQVQLQGRNTW